MRDIANLIILIASLITAVTTICVFCRKIINKGFEPIYNRIDKLDINQCRNYLVDYLADLESGMSKDEIQTKRAYEIYDHYTELGGNSYIHDKWERLMK